MRDFQSLILVPFGFNDIAEGPTVRLKIKNILTHKTAATFPIHFVFTQIAFFFLK